MSKFSLDVLEKRVFPFVADENNDIILGSSFGEDVALTKVGGDILASHVDPIVGAIGNIGWLAVHVACNDIAASGIPPRWVLLLVLVPSINDEELLEQIMRDARRAADEIGVAIIGGHTGYSANLTRPLVSVTALGNAGERTPVKTGGARDGDLVLVTKGIAVEGTGILAGDFADIAREKGITEAEAAEALRLMNNVSVVREALVLAENGATAMHDVTRGGLLETLLEIAALSKRAINIDAGRLPIDPVVERFAHAFEFDPLKMISSGTLAVTVPPEKEAAVSTALDGIDIPYAFIGNVTEGKGVSIRRGDDVSYFSEIRCEEDELARMWTLYPRI